MASSTSESPGRAARHAAIACAALAAVSLGAACDSRRVDGDTLDRVTVTDRQVKRALDVLFVIDDSSSMGEEQVAVAAAFDDFLARLEQIEGGLPDLRVAVVSTDLGTGPWSVAQCTELGQAARLQNRGCLADGVRWMEDAEDPDCAGPPQDCRLRNFAGTPQATFACISALGTQGCGFEQPLEAMKRALEQNPDFLREQAALAVIFLGDEDDCSTAGYELFDTSAEQDALGSALGPLRSYRCFEHGVVCDPDDPRVAGVKAGCAPREDSRYLHPVARYVDFIAGLKPVAQPVVVAAVIGPADPVEVRYDFADGTPALVEACASKVGHAEPGVRLQALVDATGGVSYPICNSGAAGAAAVMTQAAETIVGTLVDALDGACLDGLIHDVDDDRAGVQADCLVIEGAELDEIPSCATSGGARPCYRIGLSDTCLDTATGLAIFVDRDTSPPPGTKVSASCRVRRDDEPTRSVYDCSGAPGGAGPLPIAAALATLLRPISGARRRRRRAPTAS